VPLGQLDARDRREQPPIAQDDLQHRARRRMGGGGRHARAISNSQACSASIDARTEASTARHGTFNPYDGEYAAGFKVMLKSTGRRS